MKVSRGLLRQNKTPEKRKQPIRFDACIQTFRPARPFDTEKSTWGRYVQAVKCVTCWNGERPDKTKEQGGGLY